MTDKNKNLSPKQRTLPSPPNEHTVPPSNGVHQPAVKNASTSSPNEYAQLKQLVKQKGLLEKQPGYMVQKLVVTLGLFGVGVTLLIITNALWLQLILAAYFAFVFTQLAFISHDVGHRQAFHSARKNDTIGYLISNLLLGMSYSWWIHKHNQHHSHPNAIDLDPDIDIPILAFSEEQAINRSPLVRPIIKYQAYFFFPVLFLETFSLRGASILFLLQKKGKAPLAELALIITHLVLYVSLLFLLLGTGPAILFILVHQGLFGLYLGSVFAPNHKGMLILGENETLDFLRQQVLTARNVKANPVTDFWYGGLNYQIEHHLFPGMSRSKLREAQEIVQTFCDRHAIRYYETSILQSYQEILEYLHEVSAPLRLPKGSKSTI